LLDCMAAGCGFGLAMACLVVHWPSERVNRICRDLACSNELRKRVVWLVEHRDTLLDADALGLADLKLLMAQPGSEDLLTLTRAWLEVTDQSLGSYDRIVERVRAIPPDEVAPAPFIDGEDLIGLGLSPGPIFKRVLDHVYRAQLEGTVANKDEAMTLARTQADLG